MPITKDFKKEFIESHFQRQLKHVLLRTFTIYKRLHHKTPTDSDVHRGRNRMKHDFDGYSSVNIGSSRFLRSGKMLSTGLKIHWEKSRARSNPTLGTNQTKSLEISDPVSF